MDSSARVRVYFSFERSSLDGFYKMRLRKDVVCPVRSRGALCRWSAVYSKHGANLLEMRAAQLGRRAGLWWWAFGIWGVND